MATGTIKEYGIETATSTVTQLIDNGAGISFYKRNGIVFPTTQSWSLGNTTSVFGNVIATIPSGFRPKDIIETVAIIKGRTDIVYDVVIKTDGKIEIYNPITVTGWLVVSFPSWIAKKWFSILSAYINNGKWSNKQDI